MEVDEWQEAGRKGMTKIEWDRIKMVPELEQALLSLNRVAAMSILNDTVAPGKPIQALERLVVQTLERIGAGWEEGRVALSQVYMSGRIIEDLLEQILPHETSLSRQHPPMAIAVLEDYHLLGKRLVYAIVRAAGFELLDYGRMEEDSLVARVETDRVEILLISTLMLASALRVQELRQRLNHKGLKVKLIVGGAPFRFDPQLWREVGADAMGLHAAEALEIINSLLVERQREIGQ
jgi:methanogenic corrinoid protein MtbC1